MRDFDTINRELALFDPALAKRPQIVVLNKTDLPDVERARRRLTTAFARRKIRLLAISAATGEGVAALLEEAWKVIAAERRKLSTGAEAVDSEHEVAHMPSSPEPVRPKVLTPRAPSTRSASSPARRRPGRPREH